MKVFILHNNKNEYKRRELFVLTRPFYNEGNWIDENCLKQEWGLNPDDFQLTNEIEQADFVLIPKSINFYFKNKRENELFELNSICKKNGCIAYGYIGGDFCCSFKEFSNIIYFRMGGFKSKLSNNNKGFPVSLSDHFQRIFNQETITPSIKKEIPIIGFCGQASQSTKNYFEEIVSLIFENCKRFFKNPFNKNYEPLFASALQRFKLLKSLEGSPLVITNFIYRNNYRAGVKNDVEREKTTLEYYNNINESDYVLCVRGAGNFSVRFYETLMMGKIPIFVNTDCLLPFEEEINWKNHVVWVEWNERKNIAKIVSEFHNDLSNEDFLNLQISNRKLWKETLSVNNMFSFLNKKIK